MQVETGPRKQALLSYSSNVTWGTASLSVQSLFNVLLYSPSVLLDVLLLYLSSCVCLFFFFWWFVSCCSFHIIYFLLFKWYLVSFLNVLSVITTKFFKTSIYTGDRAAVLQASEHSFGLKGPECVVVGDARVLKRTVATPRQKYSKKGEK